MYKRVGTSFMATASTGPSSQKTSPSLANQSTTAAGTLFHSLVAISRILKDHELGGVDPIEHRCNPTHRLDLKT